MAEQDTELARELVPLLERKAGRVMVNGFPTGVEVCYAMVHGGPSPATSDSRVTSVGAMSIERFLRPVCYQDFPAELLPEPLQDANPLHLWRLVEGSCSSSSPTSRPRAARPHLRDRGGQMERLFPPKSSEGIEHP